MKTILTTLFLLGTVAAASAQGTVIFSNTSATKVSTNGLPDGAVGPTYPFINGYYYALMVAPTTQTTVDPALLGWTFTGDYATNITATSGGRFSGGAPATGVVVPGYGSGEAANFLVVGWSADIGHDWSTVYSQIIAGYGYGYVGRSDIATNVVLGSPGTPTPLFGYPPLLAGFTLYKRCPQPPYFWVFSRQPYSQTVSIGGNALLYVEPYCCPWPTACYWFFNGALINGASGTGYQITNAGPANAGQYFVILYNSLWPWPYQTSAVATLTVRTPAITPAAQTAEAGASVSFRAPAYGYPSQAFAWYLNRTQAMGHGNGAGTLLLSNVQTAQSGNYTLVLTNLGGGFVTNGPAALSVIDAVPRTLVTAVSVSGPTGGPVTLESATSLSSPFSWLALGTLDFTNAPQWYVDPALPIPAEHFYRAWRPVNFGSAPALGLAFAPALTISGTVGSTVRLDYINQFGPTNNWVTLSAITLTNSAQVYFDTSAIGQPPRLWRSVTVP